MTRREPFGRLSDGRAIEQITIETETARCEILTLGGILRSFTVDGVDVVLGLDSVDAYVRQTAYLGALIGRCANRIGGAAATLDGVTWQLSANEGANHLHGGTDGFDRRVWSAELLDDGVRLSLVSPHLDQGYPGELRVSATYTLRGSALMLAFEAVCDRETLCNLTCHPYFNLGGGRDILRHALTLFAEAYTPLGGPNALPTGELLPMGGTPLDFRSPTPVGARIAAEADQLRYASGYDHNFVIDGAHGTLRPAAVLCLPENGLTLTVETTAPGLHLYTGNFLADGTPYQNRAGLALEPQFYPDAPNHPNFPQPNLKPGEIWRQTTRFTVSPRPVSRQSSGGCN